MAISSFTEKHITVGIAGHVDHGKSTLVHCLTGIDTNRLKEEKKRRLSIASGIAPLKTSSGIQIALVDVPGHTDFLKNTIRGLSCVDMAILVVAADDGVMPQTREHLSILNFFGVKSGLIVLSKADLVDNETIELAELEIRNEVEGTFLEQKPIIPFSSYNQIGLQDIKSNIEKEANKIAGKNFASPFRLFIDQVWSFTGLGTVASGTVLSGTIRKDDSLILLPSGKGTRARFLEVHHQKVSHAFAGQRLGLNLHKLSLNEVKRGMVLAKPETVSSDYLFNAELSLLRSSPKSIKTRQRVKLYIGTSVTNALIVIINKKKINPGERGLIQFRLMKRMAALPRDPFVICPLNIKNVIGGGKILEIAAEKFRAVKAEKTIPYIMALQQSDLKAVIDFFFNRNLLRPVTENEISQNTGFSIEEIEKAIKPMLENGDLYCFEDRGFFEKTHYNALKNKLLEIIKNILLQNPLKKTAISGEIKNLLSPSLDEAIFQRMLEELCREEKILRRNGGFNIPNLSVSLSKEHEKLINMLLDFARNMNFVHFSANTFWKFHQMKFNKNLIQKLLDYLYAQKKLIRLNNRRFLTPQAMEQIKEKIKQVIIRKGGLTLADSKDILGYGRSGGVPVLEYLDEIGFTRRNGNGRALNN
ncbi:MAG: selenocysteine-specific translation elongation factor [Proteobacteria bacterium]|nr:selenocysteine-specific translation elongation factor [Pseudomonadota bacterium]